jgi:hypothetical protein
VNNGRVVLGEESGVAKMPTPKLMSDDQVLNTNMFVDQLSVHKMMKDRAPAFANMRRCAQCLSEVTVTGVFQKKRHHCKACGLTFCNQCLQKQAHLAYREYEGAGKLVC